MAASHESRLRPRLLPAESPKTVRRTWRTQSVLTCVAKVLLSCLLFFAPVSIASSQIKLPEGTTVLEVAVNDQLLALTKEQIPKLIETATADGIPEERVLG